MKKQYLKMVKSNPNDTRVYGRKYREMCRKAQAKYRQNNKEKLKQYKYKKEQDYLRKKQEKDNNQLIGFDSLFNSSCDNLFMEQLM